MEEDVQEDDDDLLLEEDVQEDDDLLLEEDVQEDDDLLLEEDALEDDLEEEFLLQEETLEEDVLDEEEFEEGFLLDEYNIDLEDYQYYNDSETIDEEVLDFVIIGNLKYNIHSDYVGVSMMVDKSATSVEILPEVNGLPVLYIGYLAFEDSNLTSVTIPDSITEIGMRAFSECLNLESVLLPNSLTFIGFDSFKNCTSLTNIILPDSLTTLWSCAFYGCTGLTSIILPNSLTYLGGSAFYGCSGLTSVTIPNSVVEIGSSAFSYCTGLTSITIPNSVTEISSNVFSFCTGLTEVTIPNSVTEISLSAFYGCTGLTSVTIPNSVIEIGDRAFYGCAGLTSVTMPNSVTFIGDSAFSGCTALDAIFLSGNTYTYFYDFNSTYAKFVYTTQYPSFNNSRSYFQSQYAANYINYPGADAIYNNSDGSLESVHFSVDGVSFTFYPYGDKYFPPVIVPNEYKDLEENEFYVSVTNEDGLPVVGAWVTFNDQKLQVDTDGTRKFTYDESMEGKDFVFEVSKEGYYDETVTRSASSYGSLTKVPITLINEDSGVQLKNIGLYSGNTYLGDPRYEAIYLKGDDGGKYVFDSDATFMINMIPSGSTASDSGINIDLISKYEIVQNGEVKYSFDAIGENYPGAIIDIPIAEDSYGNKILKNMDTYGDVYLRITADSGTVTNYKLSLFLSEPISFLSVDKGYISLFDMFTFETGKVTLDKLDGLEIKLPFFEHDFKFGLPKIEYGMIIEEDGTVTIGIGKEGEYSSEDFKKNQEKYTKNKISNSSSNVSKLKSKLGLGPFGFDASAGVYGQGVLSPDHNTLNINSALNFDVSGSAKASIPFPVPQLSKIVSINLGGTASAGVNTDTRLNINTKTMETNSTNDYRFDLGVETSIGLAADVFLAEAEITGATNIDSKITTGNNKNLTVDMGGNLSIYYRVLFSVKDDIELASFTLDLYPTFGNFQGVLGDGKSIDVSAINLYDKSGYKLISRDYLNKPAVISDTANVEIIKSNVYSGTSYRAVNDGKDTYVFWLEDNISRDAINRTELVYSSSSDNFATITPVDSSSDTADYDFDVVVDSNGDLHVVWINLSDIFVDTDDMDTVAPSLDVSYTTIRNGTANAPTTLITDEYANLKPVLSKDADYILWVSNELEDGLLGEENTYTIKYSSVSAPTNIKSLNLEGSETLNQISIGKIGNQDYIAYIVDEDGDGETYDTALKLHNISTNTTTTLATSESVLTNLVFDNSTLYWYEDSNIRYTADTSNIKNVFEEDDYVNNLNGNFTIIQGTSDNTTKLAWETLNSDDDIAGAIYCVESSDGGANWSNIYKVANTSNEISNKLYGVTDSSGDEHVFMKETIINESDRDYHLKLVKLEPLVDLVLEGVGYLDNELILGEEQELAIYITNDGSEEITSFNLDVTSNDTALITQQTISETILAGETKEILIDGFKLDNPIGSLIDIEFKISTTNPTDDTNTNNNTQVVSVGHSDLSVKAVREVENEQDIARIVVSNGNSIPASGKLKIYEDDIDGEELYELDIENIVNGKNIVASVNLTTIEQEKGRQINTYYISVENDKEELITYNNSDLVYIGLGRITPQEPSVDTYAISFDSNGGSEVLDVETDEDGKLTSLPSEPTRSGYTFEGWFLDDETFLKEVSTSTTFSKDTTVYAKWEEVLDVEDTYAISFDSNGGSEVLDVETDEDGKLTSLPSEPTRSGYTFEGWYLDDVTFLKEVSTSTTFSKDTTVYAKWEKVSTTTGGSSSSGGSSGGGGSSLGSASSSSSSTEATTESNTTEASTEATTTTVETTTPEVVTEPSKTLNIILNTDLKVKLNGANTDEERTIIKDEYYATIISKYTDLTSSSSNEAHWGRHAVAFCIEQGYFDGVYGTELNFGTEDNASRLEIVRILANMVQDISGVEDYNGEFNDLPLGTEGANAVAWAVSNNITNGTGKGVFSPDTNVERQQMAVFFDRFVTSLELELPVVNETFVFTDNTSIYDYAKNSILKLQQAGIMNGNDDGTFKPTASITRAELATMIENFVNLLATQQEESGLTETAEETPVV